VYGHPTPRTTFPFDRRNEEDKYENLNVLQNETNTGLQAQTVRYVSRYQIIIVLYHRLYIRFKSDNDYSFFIN